jgi:hypothetical protein
MDQKEWKWVTKMEQSMFDYWCAFTKAQDSNENLVCFLNDFVLTKLWNSKTPLPFVIEINNGWHFKVVCQVH